MLKHSLRNVGHTELEFAAARSSSASSNSTERSSAAWMLVSVPAHGDFWLCNSARCATQLTRDGKISMYWHPHDIVWSNKVQHADWALSRATASDRMPVALQKREGGRMDGTHRPYWRPTAASVISCAERVARGRASSSQPSRRHEAPEGQRQHMRIGDPDKRLCHSIFDIGTSFMHSDELATHILLPYPRRSRAPFVRSCGLSQSILILNQLETALNERLRLFRRHRECYKIRSRRFRPWLGHRTAEKTDRRISY